jgi:formate-dependent phosphoribosylglycinamide formyltransferase (GAR transformylase)
MVVAPADVSTEIIKDAIRVAEKAVSSLKGAGVFAVELFLTGEGQVFGDYPQRHLAKLMIFYKSLNANTRK